jgi:hypothetical protein
MRASPRYSAAPPAGGLARLRIVDPPPRPFAFSLFGGHAQVLRANPRASKKELVKRSAGGDGPAQLRNPFLWLNGPLLCVLAVLLRPSDLVLLE